MIANRDRRQEYAKAGAGLAADALARLLGYASPPPAPHCKAISIRELIAGYGPEEPAASIIIAELAGAVTGHAAIVLSREAVAMTLLRLGIDSEAYPLCEKARSALCEVGNIAISAAAGGFGALADGPVIPSVPTVETDPSAIVELDGVDLNAPEASAYVAQIELGDPERPLRLRFFWLPGR